MKQMIYKTILPVLIASLIVGVIVFAATYTDTTPDKNETTKVIEKEYTIPETVVTDTIDMEEEIKYMNDYQGDIESILTRFNTHRATYNEGLGGITSKTKPLSEATCSFPTVPTIIN